MNTRDLLRGQRPNHQGQDERRDESCHWMHVDLVSNPILSDGNWKLLFSSIVDGLFPLSEGLLPDMAIDGYST